MNARPVVFIRRHDKSYLVELTDGSQWRIWPADLALTLRWSRATEIEVLEIQDEFCTHVLFNRSDASRVRVIEAGLCWPVEKVRHSLEHG